MKKYLITIGGKELELFEKGLLKKEFYLTYKKKVCKVLAIAKNEVLIVRKGKKPRSIRNFKKKNVILFEYKEQPMIDGPIEEITPKQT